MSSPYRPERLYPHDGVSYEGSQFHGYNNGDPEVFNMALGLVSPIHRGIPVSNLLQLLIPFGVIQLQLFNREL